MKIVKERNGKERSSGKRKGSVGCGDRGRDGGGRSERKEKRRKREKKV